MRTLIVLLSFLSLDLFAQDIIYDSSRVSGFYEDFYAFRTNTPTEKKKIEFVKSANGHISNISVDGVSATNREVQKNYWGFCAEGDVYINVYKFWAKISDGSTPKSAFYKLREVGYFSLLEIETSQAIAIGGALGGAVGGLIGAIIASSDQGNNDTNTLIAIHHNTGTPTLVTKNSIIFLLAEEPSLKERFEKEGKVKKELLVQYLLELNKMKEKSTPKIEFNEKEFWPLVSIVRKPNNQIQNSIKIFVNNVALAELGDSTKYVKELLPHSTDLLIRFESDVAAELVLNLAKKQRIYYQISQSLKDQTKIEIKEIDATATSYAIETHKRKKK